jgi:hypothetical protein
MDDFDNDLRPGTGECEARKGRAEQHEAAELRFSEGINFHLILF